MKKFVIVSATLVLAFAGCSCGQGWRPNILSNLYNRIHGISNIGAPCDAGCVAPVAPMVSSGCTNCGDGVVSQYGGVGEEVIGSYPSSYEIGSVGAPTYVAPPALPGPEPVRSIPNR